MGWTGGNDVFEPMAEMMQHLGLDPQIKTILATVLIGRLQSVGWDTEDESWRRVRDDPDFVDAFRLCGIPGPDYEED